MGRHPSAQLALRDRDANPRLGRRLVTSLGHLPRGVALKEMPRRSGARLERLPSYGDRHQAGSGSVVGPSNHRPADPKPARGQLAIGTGTPRASRNRVTVSFLGLGVPPPAPSWGGMIAEGCDSLDTAPSIAFLPASAMFLTVLAFNMIGDRLRELTDPRSAAL
jgi:hypothetical protein